MAIYDCRFVFILCVILYIFDMFVTADVCHKQTSAFHMKIHFGRN